MIRVTRFIELSVKCKNCKKCKIGKNCLKIVAHQFHSVMGFKYF